MTTEQHGPGCGQRHPEMTWFRCTEPEGHDGNHVADGSAPEGQPQVTWPQDENGGGRS